MPRCPTTRLTFTGRPGTTISAGTRVVVHTEDGEFLAQTLETVVVPLDGQVTVDIVGPLPDYVNRILQALRNRFQDSEGR